MGTRERARGAIRGALVGDAAAMGLHWVMREKYPNPTPPLPMYVFSMWECNEGSPLAEQGTNA